MDIKTITFRSGKALRRTSMAALSCFSSPKIGAIKPLLTKKKFTYDAASRVPAVLGFPFEGYKGIISLSLSLSLSLSAKKHTIILILCKIHSLQLLSLLYLPNLCDIMHYKT